MQETGWIDHPNPATVDLKSEFDTYIADGSAYSFLNYPRNFTPSEASTVNFDVSSTHPLVTLVSMLGPSPDWFVGVSGLEMRDGNTWRDTITVDLFRTTGELAVTTRLFFAVRTDRLKTPKRRFLFFPIHPTSTIRCALR